MSRKALIGAITMALSFGVGSHVVVAGDDAAEISANAKTSLATLYAKVPAAKALGAKARAILVFPKVTKAGFVVGGLHGEGALIKAGKTVGYYSTTGASIGLQAGAQTYGYAMFFMNDKALQQLDSADGWEVGTGPNVVVMDEGKAANVTTTTTKDDIYAFVFSQKGLMAGVDIHGSRIKKITAKD